MRVLFVAATPFEVESLMKNQEIRVKSQEERNTDPAISAHYSLLLTGVGMVATAYSLGRELAQNRYDLAINFGIGGSFNRTIVLGDIVEITEDNIAELGAEDGDAFLPIGQLGFGESTFKATTTLANFSTNFNVKRAKAITVNTVHGNDATIKTLQRRVDAEIESMEGAAFFYACREAGVPCLQIRAVSNYVERRNRDAWQIGLAIKNLNTFASELLDELKLL